jgi:hypothetical protein
MDIGFHHGGIDAQFLAVLQTQVDSRLDHGLVDGLEGLRRQPVEGAVKGVVFGHAMAVKVGKAAQRIAVVNAFAQFAVSRLPLRPVHPAS